jgi:manganese transport protein
MLKKLRAIGPGALTAAAFIGPSTVTTATLAGATYGYALAWALVFATIAAIILQEMAARLSVVAQIGLGAVETAIAVRNILGADGFTIAALEPRK